LEKITAQGRGKTLLVVTSGGPISVIFQAATDIADVATLRIVWQIVNTSVSTFLFDGERINLCSFNQTAHLDLEGDRTLVTFR
ncbi:MAG: histidine phosphatase family protein, partial [Syntrophales bacterium]|nr:histidine phosphatase family protein [Syntrophales bacterium]